MCATRSHVPLLCAMFHSMTDVMAVLSLRIATENCFLTTCVCLWTFASTAVHLSHRIREVVDLFRMLKMHGVQQ